VSLSSRPCLPDKVSFDAATCPSAPGSASSRRELCCCHVPHSPQRAVNHMNKERPNCPRHAARLAYFQGLLHAFARHVAGGQLNADEMCGQAGCRAGLAQQTCSLVTMVYHSAEWFNNSRPAARIGRQLRCDCNPTLAPWATYQAPLQV
jgi:hypothetical protein